MRLFSRSVLRRAVFFCVWLFFCGLTLAANPFAADSGGTTVPQVRAPASAGPQKLVEWQLHFRDAIAELLTDFKQKPSGSGISAILLFSFIYGIFHALGPGHRKTVVFSLFLSRQAHAWEPVAAGFLSAFVHAATGIAIVGLVALIQGSVAGFAATSAAGAWLEGITLIALVLLSLGLAAQKITAMRRPADNSAADPDRQKSRSLYGIVVVSSIIPCPGAVLMLLFALYLNLAVLGMAGVLAMSVGMGMIISAAGYLAYFGRTSLFKRLQTRAKTVGLVSDLLELLSYVLVLVFALFMAWPFIVQLCQLGGQ